LKALDIKFSADKIIVMGPLLEVWEGASSDINAAEKRFVEYGREYWATGQAVGT
jgi:hypothetical protein